MHMDESRAVPRFRRATYTSANRFNIRPTHDHVAGGHLGLFVQHEYASSLKKKTLVRFAFTKIILPLLIKSLIFGKSLAYFHTAMAPLKFLKWIHVNTTSFLRII
jgi:hypothetical protein